MAENEGVTNRVSEGTAKKSLKNSQKKFFGFFSWNFQGYIQNSIYMILCFALHYWSKFQKNLTAFGGVIPKKNHPKAA